MPIPDVERDAECDRLVCIGVGFSDAQQLIAADWTLDQLECRWWLNDWANHPKYVQDVKASVTAHCEQSWPNQKPKDMEVSNVSALTEAA